MSKTPKHKPDFTAWFVMQGIICTMEHPSYKHTMDSDALSLYRPLSEAASDTRLITRLSTTLPYRWQHFIQEFATNVGRLEFFCFRKKEIARNTCKILNEKGITQVVTLGAGLDILSVRLAPKYQAVSFIEIDKKESVLFKTEAFERAKLMLPENVEFVQGDLREPLADILTNSKLYNPKSRTLWIAEGFLMFIPEESVVRIFREIRQMPAANSHIIFTTIPQEYPGSRIGQMLQRYFMKKENCQYAWTLPLEKADNFIKNQHLSLIDKISYEELQNYNSEQKKQLNKRLIEDIHIVEILER